MFSVTFSYWEGSLKDLTSIFSVNLHITLRVSGGTNYSHLYSLKLREFSYSKPIDKWTWVKQRLYYYCYSKIWTWPWLRFKVKPGLALNSLHSPSHFRGTRKYSPILQWPGSVPVGINKGRRWHTASRWAGPREAELCMFFLMPHIRFISLLLHLRWWGRAKQVVDLQG